MIRLSPSAVDDFLSCPMIDYYRRTLRLESVKTPIYFLIGRAFHAGLEIYDIGGAVEVAEQNVHQAFDRINPLELRPQDQDTLDVERVKTCAMVAGYFKMYGEERENFKNVQSEHEITFPIDEETEMYVRLDCLVLTRDDKLIIRERKTASRPSGDYYTRTKLDTQVLAQLYGVRHKFGRLPDFFHYDVIRKSELRRGVKDSIQGYEARVRHEYLELASEKQMLVRHDVIPDMKRVNDWFGEMQRIAKLIRTVRNNKAWWKNPNNCVSGYISCPWLPACDSGTHLLPIYRSRPQ